MLQAGLQSQHLLTSSVAAPCFPCCCEWGFCLAQYFRAAVVQELLLIEVRRVCLLFTPQAEGEVCVLSFVPTCFLQTTRCFQHQTVLVLWSWPLQALKPQPVCILIGKILRSAARTVCAQVFG